MLFFPTIMKNNSYYYCFQIGQLMSNKINSIHVHYISNCRARLYLGSVWLLSLCSLHLLCRTDWRKETLNIRNGCGKPLPQAGQGQNSHQRCHCHNFSQEHVSSSLLDAVSNARFSESC